MLAVLLITTLGLVTCVVSHYKGAVRHCHPPATPTTLPVSSQYYLVVISTVLSQYFPPGDDSYVIFSIPHHLSYVPACTSIEVVSIEKFVLLNLGLFSTFSL